MTASQPSDHNLLFGILALQNDLVTRDQLVEAMNAWALAKHRPLGDLLRERGALACEDQAVIEALVQRHLARCNQDAERCLRALSLTPSALEALSAQPDADVQGSLSRLGTLTALEPANPSDLPRRPQEFRYRILRPHARGGLGEVFVAEDTELHREVALKEIQRGHAHELHGRARFLMEAEITGRLEHPGVVPVYGLGAYPDGRPYYAMRFIRGESLKDAIDRLHGKSSTAENAEGRREKGADSSALRSSAFSAVDYSGLPFRQLLNRFISVCNAIAYAHSRGVLHRDLKPSNVMLGPFGETLVVDWGLAKVVGTQRGDPPSPDGADATLRPASGSSVVETIAGAAVGTPAFMSPEQADGKIDALGPATDIYSLGATLYGLLTGKSPVQGSSAAEVLEKVRHGVVTPLRTVRSDVPKALEAVCLKAMSLRPADRYASAQDLAQDVERWLADEPVAVYREPWPVRVGRWARKHKAIVATAAAVLLTATIGLAFGMYFVNAERNRTELARQGEEKQLIEAEKSAQEAREREAETKAVLEFVENKVFAAARPEDFEWGLGHDVKLADAVKAALPFVESSFQDQPLIEARLRMTIGNSFWYLGDAKIAAQQCEKARTLYTRYRGPDHPNTLLSMNNLARSYAELGRPADALPLLKEVLALRTAKLGPHHPDTLISMNNLALSYDYLGRHAEAAQLHEETLALRKAKLGPGHLDTLKSMHNLARNYGYLGRYADARKLSEEALALLKAKLGPDHPDTFMGMHALAYNYAALGQHLEAIRLYEQVLALRRAKLGLDHYDTLRNMYSLAGSYAALGRRAEAIKLLDEMLPHSKAKLGPDDPRKLQCMHDLAVGYAAVGRHAEAVKLHEETLTLRRAKLGPDHPDTLQSMHNLAGCHFAAGRHTEAIKLNEETLTLRKAKLGPDHPDTLHSMHNLAMCHFAAGRHAEAVKLYEETLTLRRAKLGPDHPDTIYSMHNLADSYARVGKHAGALKLQEETLALRQVKLGPNHADTLWSMYGIACVHALMIAKADDPAKEADLAMEWLKKTVTAGFKDVDHMKKDKDLDALRDREDFKKLLAELEAKGK